MKNWHQYRIFSTMILVTSALHSWGSTTLPQPSFKARCGIVHVIVLDTVPAKTPAQANPTSDQAPVIEAEVTAPVTKRVPRSRKKLKPAAVNTPVRPRAAPVIKPRIVIKKITVKTL